MLIDNFEQHLVNFVLKVQNAKRSLQNQINSLNTLKIENPETPEINRKLSKSKKNPVLIVYHY